MARRPGTVLPCAPGSAARWLALGYAALVLAAPASAQDGALPLPLPARPAPATGEDGEVAAALPVRVGPERVSDDEIARMLRGVFAEIEELAEVRVEVSAGVVHLTGTAATREDETKAVALARRIEGVLYVDNDLAPPEQAQEQIAPALEKVRARVRAIADKLPLLALAALVVLIGYTGARLIRGRGAYAVARKRNPLVRGLYRQIAGAALFIAALLLALDLLQATSLVSAVLGAAGVLGLTLGLALRDIAANYLSSILLSLRRPFDAGDLVRILEFEGRVMRLTTRDTTLMTLDGNNVRLPNATVFNSVIVNYSRNPMRQFDVLVGVAAHQSLLDAQRAGIEGLRRTPGVAQDPPPFARVEAFGSSFMEVRFFAWVDQHTSDWWKVRSEAVRHLKGAFEQAGIELPPPSVRLERAQARTDERPVPQRSTEDLTSAAHDVRQDEHLQRQMQRAQADSEEEGEDLLQDEAEPVRTERP